MIIAVMQKGKNRMAKLPKYFYFRLHSLKHGTEVEIEDASDVDVVEVVRCKDCKHRPTLTEADGHIGQGFCLEFPDNVCPCQCEDCWYNWYPSDDFYCGMAEREK
jgi:hypothetical protein